MIKMAAVVAVSMLVGNTVNAHDLLSYRIQHLASGECVTSNDGDGIFLLKPCGITNKYQRFNIVWDFEFQKFLLYSVGSRAYLDFTSPVRGGVYETQNTDNSLVSLVPANNVHNQCKAGDGYSKYDDHHSKAYGDKHRDHFDGLGGIYQLWYLVNKFGEYLLGAIEYTSFDTVLNPECSEFQDFFKFALIKWGDPFIEVDEKTKSEIEDYYFKQDRQGK